MPADGQILTVAQMRAAEQALIDGGETVSSLMDTAGRGAADWVWRVAAGRPVTVLCGPGNNGGDGYVIARELSRRRLDVTVVAPLDPATEAATAARQSWGGELAQAGPGGVLVDCLFGSGLSRPLPPEIAALLTAEAERHACRIAVDVPSGIDSDTGRPLNQNLPRYDLTLALGAWKRAHWLMPALAAMGERRLVPIGVAPVAGAAQALPRPQLAPPAADAHKYTRGLVLVVGGPLGGAAILACTAALRAGAGAVRLAGHVPPFVPPPDLILPRDDLAGTLADARTRAVLIGPGLGRDGEARRKLDAVLASGHAVVLDADALALLRRADREHSAALAILTPHEGELATLARAFGIAEDDKPARASTLARAARAVVVAKGPDTVIATPDGRLVFAPPTTSWLSTGGTGDVLAGIAASRLAVGKDPFAAACEAVWLHGEAARLCGPAFTASDLAARVPAAVAAAL